MSYSVETASQILRDSVQNLFRKYSIWYLAQGALMVLAGIFAIAFPALSSFAVVGVLGWLLIFAGLLQGTGLIGSRSSQAFPLHIVSSVLFVIVGIIFLRNPADNLMTLSVLLLVLLMVQGISRIVFALTIRPLTHWIWVLASGIVEIVIAIIILVGMPITALWLIGVLLGVALISEGAAMAWLAWNIRRHRPLPQQV